MLDYNVMYHVRIFTVVQCLAEISAVLWDYLEIMSSPSNTEGRQRNVSSLLDDKAILGLKKDKSIKMLHV